jgi:hypothetical protein
MSLRQPWFLVMVPKAAARSNDFWAGYGSKPPCGDLLTRLVMPENRTIPAAFGIAWFVAILLIWMVGYGSGAFSPAFSVLATVLVAGVVVASYVRLICVLMASPTAERDKDLAHRERRTGN